jgi:hypothetical protein
MMRSDQPTTATADTFPAWFMQDIHWSRTGIPLAGALLLLAPFVRRAVGRAPFLVYLQWPAYLLHQYEEHAHGAFKREVNRMLPPTFGRLTDQTIFVANIPGVWGVDIAATYLSRFVGPGAGLVAPYLAVVNGLIHVGTAVRTRRYNPGLWTSLLLLLPAGGASALAIGRIARVPRAAHGRGLAASVLLHLLAIALIMRNGQRQKP